MDKKVIVVGNIGNTLFQQRDCGRIISGKGTMYTLKAHLSQERAKVLKQWKRKG